VQPSALSRLTAYPWPGNIRELENVIERAVLFCDGRELRLSDLPAEVQGQGPVPNGPDAASVTPLPPPSSEPTSGLSDGLKEQVKAAMSRLERELIVRALEQTSGNVTHAARLLKISRKGLQLKMKELGLREQGERGEG
jgi:DNA-binding NtrC family response regulator